MKILKRPKFKIQILHDYSTIKYQVQKIHMYFWYKNYGPEYYRHEAAIKSLEEYIEIDKKIEEYNKKYVK